MTCRFKGAQTMALYQRLLVIQQTMTMVEHKDAFELLQMHLRNINEDFLIAIFINGLEEAIKAELIMQLPVSLPDAIEQAERIEERNQALVDLGWNWKPTHQPTELPSIPLKKEARLQWWPKGPLSPREVV